MNVTVFYEVLCPDSRHFILRQLFPTWQKVSELMEIDYRPFGKATVSKSIIDDIQFSNQIKNFKNDVTSETENRQQQIL